MSAPILHRRLQAGLLTGFLAACCTFPHLAAADSDWRFSGEASLALRLYPRAPVDDQEHLGPGLRLAPEWTWRGGDDLVRIEPLVQLENPGSGRSKAEFKELLWSRRLGETTLDIGITRVFWGVAESRHLINLINPPDLAVDYTGETTLGIPLLRLDHPTDLGRVELILAPEARDPRFPGQRGRPRTSLPVQDDVSHPDGRPLAWAARLTLDGDGAYDAHLYHFQGLDREAVLTPRFPPAGPPDALIAHRHAIRQWGADLQAPIGSFLFKAEALVRSGYSRSFGAVVLGGEYTWNGVADSPADLGLLLEYQWDNRPADAPLAPMRRALYTGLRLALNDPASTEMLFGVSHSLENSARIWRGEVRRRLGETWTVEARLDLFTQVAEEPALAGFERDSLLELRLARHF